MDYHKTGLLRRMLENPKWVGYPIILVLVAAVVLLMIVGGYRFYDVIKTIVETEGFIHVEGHFVAAQIVTIIDLFILVTGLFIFATAVYKFFIGPIRQKQGMKVQDIDELKISISKVVVLFLVTYLAQTIVDVGSVIDTVYVAVAVGIGCSILIWFINSLNDKGSVYQGNIKKEEPKNLSENKLKRNHNE